VPVARRAVLAAGDDPARDLVDVRAAATRSGIVEIPVDGEIGIVAARLSGLHGDPADRLIVATGLCRRATVMTADEKLLSMKGGAAVVDATV
jgi:PIN domain nuclease of toxin-antitoxin system